jgi:hypothetical protein
MEGTIEVVMSSPDIYLGLYTPLQPGRPRTANASYPDGDLSFLHGIAAIGTKFHAASQLGPQSETHQAEGTYRGKVYLNFQP